MTCRELSEFLMDYLSGELPPDQRQAFRAHLDECPDCVAYVKSYEDSVKLGKAAFTHPDDSLPPQVPDRLVEAILAARRKRGEPEPK